jgi:hypothetical protein
VDDGGGRDGAQGERGIAQQATPIELHGVHSHESPAEPSGTGVMP